MATFAKTSFNAARYASVRPTYPRQLFDFVFKYHEQSMNAQWDTAVDLGCGTGQATTELIPFKQIIGVDPSAKMIEQAQASLSSFTGASALKYVQSSAEDLSFLDNSSVDVMVSAQAAHWFDWKKLWPEVSRVLRPGGSAAFWGYSEFRLPEYASLTPLIHSYSQGSDPTTSIGPHWEQPGRSILDNHLLEIPSATEIFPEVFSDFQRIFYTTPYHPHLPGARPVILSKSVTWSNMLTWLRTASALHNFHEKYPEDLKNPDGDLSQRFWKQLMDGAAEADGRRIIDDETVRIEWPMALLLAKRREGSLDRASIDSPCL